MRQDLQIAIDGLAGVGKSTVGERLAKRLHYLYLDTGAMYRALTWLALQREIDPQDGTTLGTLAEAFDLDLTVPTVVDGRQYTVLVEGRDITWALRSAAVDHAVSAVSRHPQVRSAMRVRQQARGERGGVVMVGRDVGTVVLPRAQVKVFLTASLEERARRRWMELKAKQDTAPSFEGVLADVQRRDAQDSMQSQPAPDAVILATDYLSVEQVIERILELLHERV
jgi:cytidylate kinase